MYQIGIIDAKTIHGFTLGLLAAKYDNPKPIPPFHEEMWELCCSDAAKVAIAAPRGHAKSTAITHAYILAMMLFQECSFCLLVSDTEAQAAEFLGDIKSELNGNAELRKAFKIRKLIKETETNIICQTTFGGVDHLFRIQAKGSEQKVRGLKWRGKRPDLIVGDDLENDEIVMNPERREKFRRWFMNALMPCGSDTCRVRVVGTILHLDAMLKRLLDDPTWKHLFFRAHNPDFTEILWPEQFSQKRLLDIRAGYEAQNDLGGYNQEYLNNPVAEGDAYFNRDCFIDVERDDNGNTVLPNLEMFAAADFAISEKEKADYTVLEAAGVDEHGTVHVIDVRRGRWNADQIIEELILFQKAHKPNIFTFESGQIEKSLRPILEREMARQNVYINIEPITPTQSKTMRGRSIQAMHNSKSIRYDKKASWYPDYEGELMTITKSGPRGAHDDHFDSHAYIGLTINQYYEAQSQEEIEEEEYEEAFEDFHNMGRSTVTGY